MAGFITAEGLVVAAGADTYDYVNDQRRLAGSIRSLVPAATEAGGDTIAAAMNTDGRPVSATNPLFIYNQATRNLEWKDASGWNVNSMFSLIPSVNALIGSPTGLGTNIASGAVRPVIQAGTFSTTTDASGYAAYNYPTAFPNGILATILTNGDSSASGRGKIMSVSGNPPFTQTLATLYISVADGSGTGLAGTAVRINYIVIGW